MPESSPSIVRLRSFLEELDVQSSTLKRDPRGQTWLPPEIRALVESDPECRAELGRFVDRELELFDSVRQRNDPMFAKDVLNATHSVEIAGSGLDPRIRSWILGLFYALATIAAYATLAPLFGLSERGSVLAQARAALGLASEATSPSAWGLATVGAAVALALLLAFMPCRRPRSRA
ncbi:hypothetical protein SAMN02745121_00713 [Nannocystis exedens]|uniref:Uncharacterized protein n=1 Tax=Nannocystis exedens TaxID=54 RepID=A0A1I1THD4_9BACT|nr:hypothetical protein [Nannocystis exedens]PCC66558.1 hypothetical protein NAEX_09146 [Nannocystis exedens]SFD58051.1 hypothetical protein SAMN02745121_00713 [Nannocystis exedens]